MLVATSDVEELLLDGDAVTGGHSSAMHPRAVPFPDAEGDTGVLVVTSDDEELLLEDDAVVVGLPDVRLGAGGADASAAVPLQPPPAEEVLERPLVPVRSGRSSAAVHTRFQFTGAHCSVSLLLSMAVASTETCRWQRTNSRIKLEETRRCWRSSVPQT